MIFKAVAFSSTSVLMPVGRCSPKLARSAADEKHELLHAFDDDLGEHHEPRRERSTPQQNVDRLRHAIPPRMTFSNRQKVTEQNADHNHATKILQAPAS
jgi:hypothetical protein